MTEHRTPSRVRGVLATGVGVALGTTMLVPAPARADSSVSTLNAQKNRVASAQQADQNALDDDAAALVRAQAALTASQAKLAQARRTLATATAARRSAQQADSAAAKAAATARANLAAADGAVADGVRKLAAQRQRTGAVVRSQAQQGNPLLSMAVLLTNRGMSDINQQTQWATTLFDTTQTQMDALTAAQYRLEAAQQAQRTATTAAVTAKAAAATRVTARRTAEASATKAAASVAALVRSNQQAQLAFQRQVAADKAQQASLASEAAAVETRLKAAIAKQKALAAAQAAAAARARAASGTLSPNGSTSATTWFDWPVLAPVTSPFGMRFHPILHVWKLHDGTDLGAACGTAIKAPRDGVVSEEYFNAGYGNRLMLDHGLVDGHYVTTGYNHAQRYVVKVGQRVTRGQVIGYVGTTGFSTGCHLHLMVWQDGSVVNPMSHWF